MSGCDGRRRGKARLDFLKQAREELALTLIEGWSTAEMHSK